LVVVVSPDSGIDPVLDRRQSTLERRVAPFVRVLLAGSEHSQCDKKGGRFRSRTSAPGFPRYDGCR